MHILLNKLMNHIILNKLMCVSDWRCQWDPYERLWSQPNIPLLVEGPFCLH